MIQRIVDRRRAYINTRILMIRRQLYGTTSKITCADSARANFTKPLRAQSFRSSTCGLGMECCAHNCSMHYQLSKRPPTDIPKIPVCQNSSIDAFLNSLEISATGHTTLQTSKSIRPWKSIERNEANPVFRRVKKRKKKKE